MENIKNVENKIKVEIDLKAVYRIIFGNNNCHLDYQNINVWKDNVRKELRNLLNDLEIESLNGSEYCRNKTFNLELIWELLDLVDNIEFTNNGDYFIIDNKVIDINMVETIFNIYAINNFKNYDIVINDKEKKLKRMKNFIDEVQKRNNYSKNI